MPQGKRHIKKKQVLRDLDRDYWFNHNSSSTVVGIVCYCWEAEIIISQGENGQCFIFPGLLWRKHWETNSIHFVFCYCGQAKLHWMNTTEPPCRSSYSGRLSWIPRAAVWHDRPEEPWKLFPGLDAELRSRTQRDENKTWVQRLSAFWNCLSRISSLLWVY